MFACAGFSSVSYMEICMRLEGSDPFLRFSLFLLNVSDVFGEGSEVFGNFQFFPCKMADLSYPISLGVSAIVSGSDIYPLICRRSLWDLRLLFYLIFWGGLQSSHNDCFALVSGVHVSILLSFCSCRPLTKKILKGTIYFSLTEFLGYPHFLIFYEE